MNMENDKLSIADLRRILRSYQKKPCRLKKVPVNNCHAQRWLRSYINALLFRRQFGRFPYAAETFPGTSQIGQWLYRARQDNAARTLKPWKKHLLKAAGIEMQPIRYLNGEWEDRYEALIRYRGKNPDRWPPPPYKTPDGKQLGRWVEIQRQRYTRGTLEKGQLERLREIKFPLWKIEKHNDRWMRMYDKLVRFKDKNPDQWPVKHDYASSRNALGTWCSDMRSKRKQGILSSKRIALLEKIGFEWDVLGNNWNRIFEQYRGFLIQHNRIPRDKSRNMHERKLAWWFSFQKARYAKGALSRERLKRLLKAGIRLGNRKSDGNR